MARTVTLNGQSYSVPEPGDVGYDAAATAYLLALAGVVGPNALVTATGSTTARTLGDRFADAFNVKDYGAKGDGTTDDAAAIQAAINAAAASGGMVVLPRATYRIGTRLSVTGPAFRRVSIHGYGAELVPDAGVNGIYITGGTTTGGVSVYGLKVNHRGNATATAGFDIAQAWYTHLIDCTVEAHGVPAGYAAFLVRQSNATDPNTGSFWTRIDHPIVGKRSGSDVGDIPYGIVLRGAANATTIVGGSIGNTTVGVSIQIDPGQTYVANGVVVDGVAFETYGTGIEISGAATSTLGGHRFVNNRFEVGTTVFSFTGTTTQPISAPFLAGNFLVSSAGTYLNNPNGLYVTVLDVAITPLVTASMKTDLVLEATSGSTWPVSAKAVGGGRGYQLQKGDGTQIGSWAWTGTGTNTRLSGVGSGGLYLSLTKALSATSTDANNLRGTVTVTGATTTGTMTFGVAEPDASYFLALTPVSSTGTPAAGSNRILSISKAAGSFTVTVEVAPGAGNSVTFDWHLIR